VPKSTVYDWARKGVVLPTVSPVQEKLWSYADLMALRIVAWLRRPKAGSEGLALPANPMREVRAALVALASREINLWSADASHTPLVVDRTGQIFIWHGGEYADLRGNHTLPHEEHFGVLEPFRFEDGRTGPDLLRPRPHLRILPERVAGEPHVQDTRLTSRTLAGMVTRGFSLADVAEMYSIEREFVEEAVDLELSLVAA
jgi:uncharacterized protein (DUF433 family)